ncbi:hypothetical protein APHAL10511_007841 [Amanita phalloides]|nr:hypothetical protein APHAL10511_007841 [Amanita phalloides]
MHPSFSSSLLGTQLAVSLASRDAREIRRRLPAPTRGTATATATTAALADFTSNDYLSLSSSPVMRSRFLHKLSTAPCVLGSGGSRLLINGDAHVELEARLARFFGSEAALLLNSGFDANVAFFECVPQPGDVVVYDEYVHASVHDGMRASRVAVGDRIRFGHNDVADLRRVLADVRERAGGANVFVAVESVYSMDGTLAPLRDLCDVVEEANGYVIVDEAHATGLYGPQGKGRVAMFGLEKRVLARLCTFGKALGVSGGDHPRLSHSRSVIWSTDGRAAVLLTNRLIRDYMLNYARPLIYTTSMSYANVIAVDCSFDLLENGTAEKVGRLKVLVVFVGERLTGCAQLADQLFGLVEYFLALVRPRLQGTAASDVLSLPAHLARLPDSRDDLAPIIPLHTRYPRQLSAHLARLGMNARPITWPTVPKGKDRVRVCIHAGNTIEQVKNLAHAVSEWAVYTSGVGSDVMMASKL